MGFDPMGIGSWDVLNMNFLREAEIKHGRLAMLAITYYALEEFLTKASVTENTPFLFKSVL